MKRDPLLNKLPFQAFLFDLDGTLVDTKQDFISALSEALAWINRPMLPFEQHLIVGKYWEDIYAILDSYQKIPVSIEVLIEKTREIRKERIRSFGPKLLPYAKETVNILSQTYPCAIVTGSQREEAEFLLNSAGLRDCFEFLICARDTVRGKPFPDPYLKAAEKLNLFPAMCAVFEDSQTGIQAAKAAGMYCFAIKAGNFSKQDQSEADQILETLADVKI